MNTSTRKLEVNIYKNLICRWFVPKTKIAILPPSSQHRRPQVTPKVPGPDPPRSPPRSSLATPRSVGWWFWASAMISWWWGSPSAEHRITGYMKIYAMHCYGLLWNGGYQKKTVVIGWDCWKLVGYLVLCIGQTSLWRASFVAWLVRENLEATGSRRADQALVHHPIRLLII